MLTSSADPAQVRVDGEAVVFELGAGRHAYLTSSDSPRFVMPPRESPAALKPAARYHLRANVELAGGKAGLWLIEYDEQHRLRHQTHPLRSGLLVVDWITHERHASWCLAVRLEGTGRLGLGRIDLLARDSPPTTSVAPVDAGPLRIGPRGRFGRYSIFYDPSGYRRYTPHHRRFYDGRGADWYAPLVRALRGSRRVLDLGCGPGLLLVAMRQAGVSQAIGLERDPEFVTQCRDRGLTVYAHDLNLPFPFLAGQQFDAVVAHQSLDYLAPIAMRGTLRECARVLCPDGRIHLAARSDGQASGDWTRTVALTPDMLERLLKEAEFTDIEIHPRERSLSATARRPAEIGSWPIRRVHLGSGVELRPWAPSREILPPSAAAWDTAGNRDFTLLTDAGKNEMRIDGRLVGYFTAYRGENDRIERAVCRAVSADGLTWQRQPAAPVLGGGGPGEIDDGGVAAGSVILTGDGADRQYVLYYSPRQADGRWPGIGRAHSRDGVVWTKEPGLVLAAEDFPNLDHLALGDVIRTTDGRWLMHCEGWVASSGWAVFQAVSQDGNRWTPSQPEPVLDPRTIPWGGTHAANPKCVEPWPGRFLLGFNAAGPGLEFQLGLAESDDARRWRLVEASPIVCPTTDQYRVESAFMTRGGWRDGSQRLYFFAAATRQTHTSSRVRVAEADRSAGWVGEGWETERWGLYRVTPEGLVAEPGAATPLHGLRRRILVEREMQCTLRLQAAAGIVCGTATLEIETASHPWRLVLQADGRCAINDAELVAAATGAASVAACLRVLRPDCDGPEFALQVWHGETCVVDQQGPLPRGPRTLTVGLAAPPGAGRLVVEHCDVWQPPPVAAEPPGDAQMHLGPGDAGDLLLPEIDGAKLLDVMTRRAIGRALVIPYGSSRRLDSFGTIAELAQQQPGRVYPLYRLRNLPDPGPAEDEFQINQLELLWQTGRLYGLKVHLARDERPRPPVLEWLEQRQVLTFWHLTAMRDFDWLTEQVMSRYSFPVLLAHFGGYPLDRERYARAIALLDEFPQLYLVTSAVWFGAYLEQTLTRDPSRVLFGSDFPAVDPRAARGTIEHLDVPEGAKTLALSENLRFLTERVQWFRWQALTGEGTLHFPPLPANADDIAAQGFEVVAPDTLDPAEYQQAKTFWAEYEVKSWYQEFKPWARLLADLVADLRPTSVLEFGCNVGRNLAAIAAANPGVRLLGLDVNREAIELGCQMSGLDLRCGDERTLAELEPGSFDLVFTVSVIDHIADIREVCRALVRAARCWLYLLEVTLPVEGKVLKHYDHHTRTVRASTGASYSWNVAKYLRGEPRVRRLDCRPCYLHDAMLGPYYWAYLAQLELPTT
jgi:hypothetical protein